MIFGRREGVRCCSWLLHILLEETEKMRKLYSGYTVKVTVSSTIAVVTPPVLSTCYNHFMPIVSDGKKRRILVGPCGDLPLPVWNYLEVHWPCVGGFSAVNAIGTQLRDPMNSGLTRWRMYGGLNK